MRVATALLAAVGAAGGGEELLGVGCASLPTSATAKGFSGSPCTTASLGALVGGDALQVQSGVT